MNDSAEVVKRRIFLGFLQLAKSKAIVSSKVWHLYLMTIFQLFWMEKDEYTDLAVSKVWWEMMTPQWSFFLKIQMEDAAGCSCGVGSCCFSDATDPSSPNFESRKVMISMSSNRDSENCSEVVVDLALVCCSEQSPFCQQEAAPAASVMLLVLQVPTLKVAKTWFHCQAINTWKFVLKLWLILQLQHGLVCCSEQSPICQLVMVQS